MIPADYPLELYRGDSYRWQFKLSTSSGQPLDLTNVLAKAEIRDRPGGTQISPLDCNITLPNIVDVFLDSAVSHALPAKGAWDLQLNFGNGDIRTPVAGSVVVTMDVTDSTQPSIEHHGG